METVRSEGKISVKWSAVAQRGQSIESAASRYETLDILYPDASSFYQEVQGPETVYLPGGKGAMRSGFGNFTTKNLNMQSSKNGTKKATNYMNLASKSNSDPSAPLHNTSDIIR